jgi:hypothetical protein
VTTSLPTLALVFAFALASTPLARAQERPAAPPPRAALHEMALKIHVVISRYQGEKKISSLPYSLSVTGGAPGPERAVGGQNYVGRANLRMGAKIPIASTTLRPAADGNAAAQINSFQYQDVGTNIDCEIWAVDDGRFRVQIAVDDSSVYPDDKDIPGGVKGNPSFRSFRASDAMLLKDGGTGQFTTATDKVSGETVRVDVTLTVVK